MHLRTIIPFGLALALVSLVSAPAFAGDVIDHDPFDELLKEYVDGKGQVDYGALKKSEKASEALDEYVAAVGKAKVDSKSSDARLAFYINAYNALTIDAILEHYPTGGVMKIDGFFKKKKHRVAGKAMTLDELENGLIRKKFSEPRIHFALVCGAKSCPRLRQSAYRGKTLEKTLEAAAKEFVPKATKISKTKISTSKLFKWFAKDFEKAEGSVRAYLARYLPEHADALKNEEVRLTFSPYSWKLNDQ